MTIWYDQSSRQIIMTHHGESSLCIIVLHYDDSSRRVMIIHQGESWWFIMMMHNDDSSWWTWWIIMMIRHDDASCWFIMIDHDDCLQKNTFLRIISLIVVSWLLFSIRSYGNAPMGHRISLGVQWNLWFDLCLLQGRFIFVWESQVSRLSCTCIWKVPSCPMGKWLLYF